MAGCGYLCPQCEGRGFLDDTSECNWCSPEKPKQQTNSLQTKEEELEEWIAKVHGSNCCSDIGNH